MPDHFKEYQVGLSSPAGHGSHITPSDSVELTDHSRAIIVGGAGALRVELTKQPGTVITLANVLPGVVYPLRVGKVLATGTTATDIVSLW